jgi:hypothetical protein
MTITKLAEQLNTDTPTVKMILGLAKNVPNDTEVSEAQIVEATEGIAMLGQSPEKEPEAKTPKAKKKSSVVTYYWPKIKRASFILGSQTNPDGSPRRCIKRSAKNGIMVLDPANAEDNAMIDYLDKHSGNEANGGNKFARFEQFVAGEGTPISKKINELLSLPLRTLQQMAAEKLDGSLVKAANMSTGEMIDLILELS